jgi:hypothetical protein
VQIDNLLGDGFWSDYRHSGNNDFQTTVLATEEWATMRPEHGKLAADWLDRWTGHLTTTDFSQY